VHVEFHEWSPCEVHGHQYEEDEQRPGHWVCVQSGCDDAYDD
jgi:hypothetical protein